VFRLKLPKMLYAYQPVEALKGTRASQQISRSDLVQWRFSDITIASFDVCSSGNNHRHHKATFVDFLLGSLTAHWSTTKMPGQVRCETFTF